jgi:hypothetical protein
MRYYTGLTAMLKTISYGAVTHGGKAAESQSAPKTGPLVAIRAEYGINCLVV